jgi:branched-chain amino acid transport system permease protein
MTMADRFFLRNGALWGGTAVLVALLVLPPFLPQYVTILLTQSLVYAIVAMSLDVLIGYTGLGSLGHAAFFAIGAYVTAIFVTKYQAPFWLALLLSTVSGTLGSAVAAPIALRAAGIYFLMITLAIAMCVWGLAFRWVSLTGGDNGITGIPRPDLGLGWDMGSTVSFYYLILLFALTCLGLLYLLIRSPFGKTLVGIRDGESRMRVLGYNVWLHKYLAMVIAGAFAGLSGSLYAYFNSFVSPNDVNIGHCMEMVLMVSLGGPGTLVGAGLGAFLIVFLKNLVSVYTKRWLMVLAAVYVITALYAPEGIMGLLKRVRRREGGG